MVNNPNPVPSSTNSVPLLSGKSVKNCHIVLPDLAKPTSAILYGGNLYSYVRFYAEVDAAQRAAARLIIRGNAVVLTQVRKGLILWVLEPDAQLATRLNL